MVLRQSAQANFDLLSPVASCKDYRKKRRTLELAENLTSHYLSNSATFYLSVTNFAVTGMLSLNRTSSIFCRASSSKCLASSSLPSSSCSRRFYSEQRQSGESDLQDAPKDTTEQQAQESETVAESGQSSSNKDERVLDDLLRSPRPTRWPTVGLFANSASQTETVTEVASQEDTGPPVSPREPQPGDRTDRSVNPIGANRERGPGSRTQDIDSALVIPIGVPYKLYVQAYRKNCIMTIIDHQGRLVGNVSSGMIGFRNAAEGSYEAGYQCATRMFNVIKEQKKLHPRIDLEIFLKGFGQTREALMKALTMSEGEGVRDVVRRITDRTPLKIGGVRGQKSRRR